MMATKRRRPKASMEPKERAPDRRRPMPVDPKDLARAMFEVADRKLPKRPYSRPKPKA